MLETKIRNLIDKHQKRADRHHEIAKIYYKKGYKNLATIIDREAHKFEYFAQELRMLLK